MGIQAGSARGRAVVIAAALAAAAAAGLPLAVAGPAAGASAVTRPAIRPAGVAHPVSEAAQRATRVFWTPARIASATPLGSRAAGSSRRAIPSPTHFNGVPTIGALIFTTGSQAHFCTASVVHSRTKNLILTAAHCVYGSSYATNIAFVPRYHKGIRPFGTWPVQEIFVTGNWQHSNDPNEDFAFLKVTPPSGTSKQIQQVTGALWLRTSLGYNHDIEAVGYNNTDKRPIRCATHSFQYAPDQMKFFCHDFQDGTSGGPWIVGYHRHSGTGTVFGVIGGFEQGGDFAWASYSAYFGQAALTLFSEAQQQS